MFVCKRIGFHWLALTLTVAALVFGSRFGQLATSVSAQEAKAESKPAPDLFKVKLETTQGDVVIEVHRDWSPHGVDRFYELIRARYFDDSRFHRTIAGLRRVRDTWRGNQRTFDARLIQATSSRQRTRG